MEALTLVAGVLTGSLVYLWGFHKGRRHERASRNRRGYRIAADLDHLLAALSVEKSKPIPEIRDQYGLNEGERP